MRLTITGATRTIPALRCPGEYFDVETSFHENWNRYYDPTARCQPSGA